MFMLTCTVLEVQGMMMIDLHTLFDLHSYCVILISANSYPPCTLLLNKYVNCTIGFAYSFWPRKTQLTSNL